MIKAGESFLGDYVWKQYDILVLPPSFPYGGMENPCLTFATPTIVVSFVFVIMIYPVGTQRCFDVVYRLGRDNEYLVLFCILLTQGGGIHCGKLSADRNGTNSLFSLNFFISRVSLGEQKKFVCIIRIISVRSLFTVDHL